MTYEEQLNDPRWKAKAEEIKARDWYMCQQCMSSKNLHVHHKQYIEGKMAWEYSGWYLITLCSQCHKEVHGIKDEPDNSKLTTSTGLTIAESVSAWCGLYQNELNKKSDA